jgi:hypothetical protein
VPVFSTHPSDTISCGGKDGTKHARIVRVSIFVLGGYPVFLIVASGWKNATSRNITFTTSLPIRSRDSAVCDVMYTSHVFCVCLKWLITTNDFILHVRLITVMSQSLTKAKQKLCVLRVPFLYKQERIDYSPYFPLIEYGDLQFCHSSLLKSANKNLRLWIVRLKM